ncbi:MAG: hypothetical protein JWP59_922 [Massilia sp.]|jgi:hypothetical protein|nr:hypothetical protein [Massilia sp.]
MRLSLRPFLLIVGALAAVPGLAAAAAVDGDWVSYRDAYRAMVVFEKYGKPKSLLLHQIQVLPRDKVMPGEALRLVLNGQDSQLNLPLDATGRTVFPLLKAAYDENAALVLSRKLGPFTLRARVSLVVRPDGVYDLAELRAACEQALDYARYLDASYGKKNCVGVRFGFARSGAAPVLVIKRASQAESVELRVADGAIFADDGDDSFKIVNLRFGAHPARSQLTTQDAPLAIVPLFE